MANPISGIYAITNTLNGKQYIGSSIDIEHRWGVHRSYLKRGTHHAFKLQRAWLKYGPDAFEWTVLEIVLPLSEMLLAREQQYFDTLQPRYNSALIADSTSSDPDVRARISQAMRGMVFTTERRAHISAALKGKRLSKAHRLKITENQRGRALTPEWREHISASMKDNPRLHHPKSEEHRQKMRERSRKQWQDPEYRERMRVKMAEGRAANRKPRSAESRERSRKASRAVYERLVASGAYVPRICDPMTGRFISSSGEE